MMWVTYEFALHSVVLFWIYFASNVCDQWIGLAFWFQFLWNKQLFWSLYTKQRPSAVAFSVCWMDLVCDWESNDSKAHRWLCSVDESFSLYLPKQFKYPDYDISSFHLREILYKFMSPWWCFNYNHQFILVFFYSYLIAAECFYSLYQWTKYTKQKSQ